MMMMMMHSCLSFSPRQRKTPTTFVRRTNNKLPTLPTVTVHHHGLLFVLLIAVTFLGKNTDAAGPLDNDDARESEANRRNNNNDDDGIVDKWDLTTATVVDDGGDQQRAAQRIMQLGTFIPITEYATFDAANALPASSIQSAAPISSSSFAQRLADDESAYLIKQLAKSQAMENVLHPRFQRWLLRADEALDAHPATTTTINDDDDDITNSGGQQFAVKRVVSESELNSLLKNAWLGR